MNVFLYYLLHYFIAGFLFIVFAGLTVPVAPDGSEAAAEERHRPTMDPVEPPG